MNLSTAHWRYSKDAPTCTATLKAKPEDFVVTEELGYEFSNDGEHQLLQHCHAGLRPVVLQGQLRRECTPQRVASSRAALASAHRAGPHLPHE